MNTIISKLSKENPQAIYDFNMNLLEINTRIKYQAYFDHFDQFVINDFYPKNVQPCRFTKKTFVIEHTFCKLSENTSKSYSCILISIMSEHLPHFTCLDILSNRRKPPKDIMKEKQNEASLLSFYNEIEISIRNTNFPNEITTDPNVTYNLLGKNIICQETPETCEDQTE